MVVEHNWLVKYQVGSDGECVRWCANDKTYLSAAAPLASYTATVQ
jgi:hypothetical protein